MTAFLLGVAPSNDAESDGKWITFNGHKMEQYYYDTSNDSVSDLPWYEEILLGTVTGGVGGAVSRVIKKGFDDVVTSAGKYFAKGTGNSTKNIFGLDASKPLKATELRDYAKSQGWTKTQTKNGPEKWVDQRGIDRITIKGGSQRAPGSATPHVEIKNAKGQRIDTFGNPVSRKSDGNHTPIIFD